MTLHLLLFSSGGINLKEMKNMTMSKREFTNTAKRYAKEYWDITLDIPISWEHHPKSSSYGQFYYLYKKNKAGKIIDKIPLRIVMNIYKLTEFTDELLLDVLKHELTHWACLKRKRPFSDGSKYFEKELLRIGASSTGFDMLKNDYKEKSLEYQKDIIENKKTKIKKVETADGTITQLTMQTVYKNGQTAAHFHNNVWETYEKSNITMNFAADSKWFFQFYFLINGDETYGYIAQKEDGKWTMAKGNNPKESFHKTFRSIGKNQYLRLSRNVQNQLRKLATIEAKHLIDTLRL